MLVPLARRNEPPRYTASTRSIRSTYIPEIPRVHVVPGVFSLENTVPYSQVLRASVYYTSIPRKNEDL